MGLDVSHGCFSGSYSSFSRWRNEVAKAGGYKLMKDDAGFESASIDWEQYGLDNFQGSWAKKPSDPLLYLIVHSDCDGYLNPSHARLLADRLEAILPNISNEGTGHIERYGGYRKLTEQFINGLREASRLKQKVIFR
jgi:hypothetical protein